MLCIVKKYCIVIAICNLERQKIAVMIQKRPAESATSDLVRFPEEERKTTGSAATFVNNGITADALA